MINSAGVTLIAKGLHHRGQRVDAAINECVNQLVAGRYDGG